MHPLSKHSESQPITYILCLSDILYLVNCCSHQVQDAEVNISLFDPKRLFYI